MSPKVVLITGSAKRLGREIALALAGRHVQLALHYHQSEKEAYTLLSELEQRNVTAKLFNADLTQVSQIQTMIQKILTQFGQIDALINNAAMFYETPFGSITEKDWDSFLDTNLKGPFFLIQSVATHMLTQKDPSLCKIINIADSGGPKTRANYLPYWVSKAGLIAMTETLAKIFGQTIQVNTVAPGPIAFPEDMPRLKNDIVVDPKEIIKTILHLVNDTTSVTGNTIVIDRGRRYR